jgi:hypothetical protein
MAEEFDLSFGLQCNQLTALPCSECTQQMDEANLLQYLRSFDEQRQIVNLDKENVRVIEKRDIRIPLCATASKSMGRPWHSGLLFRGTRLHKVSPSIA